VEELVMTAHSESFSSQVEVSLTMAVLVGDSSLPLTLAKRRRLLNINNDDTRTPRSHFMMVLLFAVFVEGTNCVEEVPKKGRFHGNVPCTWD
jgi:hypothetical protein